MIVKIQRPIHCTGEPELLIYNADRSIEVQVVYTPEYATLFEEYEYKVYYHAKVQPVDNGDRLTILDRCEVQDQDF